MNESARTWGLRLLALGIALAVWYSVSFEDRETLTERIVEASVSYDQPRGFVALDQVRSVNIRVRGSAKRVRGLNPLQVSVQLDLTQRSEGVFNIPLGPDRVQLPEGLEVVSVDPNVIRVELDREVTQRIPVRAQLVGEPEAGFTAGEPEVLPNQVLVTGPESIVSQIEVLSTRPVTLEGQARTVEEIVSVVSPDPLIQIVQPFRVTVRVPLKPTRSEPGETEERPLP